MNLFSKVAHHFHVRKRIHQKLEKYPSTNKWKNFLDKIIYVVGVSGPIMTMPQLLKIRVAQDASGVSLTSRSWYVFTACIRLIYGIVHKEKPLIATYILWLIVQILIVIGIIIYQ